MQKKQWRRLYYPMCSVLQHASTEGFDSSEAEYPALQHLDGLGLRELLVLAWYILQLERGCDDTPVAFVWLMAANEVFGFSDKDWQWRWRNGWNASA